MSTTTFAVRPDVTQERHFGIDELFFSTTDPKGRIRAGNDVFLRVAGYTLDEVLGQPHNLIRHPDMPRAVFRLLWDHLDAGTPIAAYVKNRARDGRPYWVLATARPVPDGYLSIRSKPCSAFFEAVKPVYVEMRRVEAEIEAAGGGRTAAMDASTEVLVDALTSLGYASYDAFMQDVLATELQERNVQLGGSGSFDRGIGMLGDPALETLYDAGLRMSDYLDDMFSKLNGFRSLYDVLNERSRSLLAFADDVALLSLNAIVASSRLEVRAPTLEAVAGAMRITCGRIADDVRRLFEEIGPAVERLGGLGFTIGLAKLQWEILDFFVGELVGQREAARRVGSAYDVGHHDHAHVHGQAAMRNVALLGSALLCDVSGLRVELQTVDELLRQIRERVLQLNVSLRQLASIELNGRVQAALAGSPQAFTTLFEQVRGSGAEAKALATGIEANMAEHRSMDITAARTAKQALDRFERAHRALAVTTRGL